MAGNPSNSTFNKATWVAMKGTSLLTNTLAMGKFYSTEYSGEYAQKYAIGRTLNVPLTQRYTVYRNDMTYQPQAFDRPLTTITMDQTASIAIEWESIEKALDMERGEERVTELYIKPAISYLRQEIEKDLAQFAHQNTNLITGALGTNPTTFDATSAACLQALFEMGCPDDEDNLGLFIPSAVNRAVKTGAATYFNPQQMIARQMRSGFVDHSDSFDWYRSNSLYTHTAGTWQSAAAVTVNGSNQSGSNLLVNCTTGDTVKKGDKISIASVNQLNLMSRLTTSTTTAGSKTFNVTADVTATAATMTIPIYPPIYGPSSHYQNVDVLPQDTALLTLWPGTNSPNGKSGKIGLGLYPGAFFLASIKLEEPEAVEICKQFVDPDTGIPIRLIRQWDNRLSMMTTRLDTMWGRGVGLAEQCSIAVACA